MSLSKQIFEHRANLGGTHRAGTFYPGPLDKIESVLRGYFPGKEIVTAETGCGASTILFSSLAQRHYVYAYDDRSADKSSVVYAQSFPGFREDRVVWNFGPTQRTLPVNPPKEMLDVVLIDGPHGYPFPDLEYYFFYPLLNPGAVLILDDINIPCIDNMFRLLCEDDMFYLDSVVMSTGFLRRSDKPTFDPTGDGWYEQRYNIQRYPLPNPFWGSQVKLPLNWSFEGRNEYPSPYLVRGFTPKEGMPVTEGPLSLIWLPLEGPTSGTFEVEIEFEPVSVVGRPDAGIEMFLQYQSVGQHSFTEPGVVKLTGQVTLKDQYHLEIKLHHNGTRWHQEFVTQAPGMVDFRLFNGVMRRLSVREVGTAVLPAPLHRMSGTVVQADPAGSAPCWFVTSPRDPVEASHAQGRYHHAEELARLAEQIPKGARILDVGSCLGDHAIYFVRECKAARVVVLESHPIACEVLRLNRQLNGAEALDVSHLGIALSEQAGRADVYLPHPDYVSRGRVAIRETGAIRADRGDAIAANETFDLIRVDVGEMTLEVLRGLVGHLRNGDPKLVVTVSPADQDLCKAMLKTLGLGITTMIEIAGRVSLVCSKKVSGTSGKAAKAQAHKS